MDPPSRVKVIEEDEAIKFGRVAWLVGLAVLVKDAGSRVPVLSAIKTGVLNVLENAEQFPHKAYYLKKAEKIELLDLNRIAYLLLLRPDLLQTFFQLLVEFYR